MAKVMTRQQRLALLRQNKERQKQLRHEMAMRRARRLLGITSAPPQRQVLSNQIYKTHTGQ